MNNLITAYFPSASSKPKARKSTKNTKKRTSSAFEDNAESDAPANASKRSKLAKDKEHAQSSGKRASAPKDLRSWKKEKPVELPLETPDASSSKLKPRVKHELVDLSSDEPQEEEVKSREASVESALPSRYPSILPPSSAPPSTQRTRRVLRGETTVPETPEHERRPSPSRPSIYATPLRSKPLSQTWSDETVGSSQSQEDEDYNDYPPLNRGLFTTPRNKRANLRASPSGGEDDDGESDIEVLALVSPRTIPSSQTQLLTMRPFSPVALKGNPTFIVDDNLEVIPSSQSQEKELEMSTLLSQRVEWSYPPRDAMPEQGAPTSPLKRGDSLSKELPVRHLSLQDDDFNPFGPKDDDNDEDPIHPAHDKTPRASEKVSTTEASQLSVASASSESYLADRSYTTQSPSKGIRIRDSGDSLCAGPLRPQLEEADLEPADLESQTQQSTQDLGSYCTPPELKAFHEMFQGEESYPADFPMSLRI
ncbi:hypothetical protein DFP72DRAFT_21069 [Ephemerocybe angulata]|uniref:Uncharacterized protein n=1 Tax=Ephemerocybe angulata TaxID=980116 RepID=A0A8H6IKQ7_9AGAR|nr:hypothetical protein DFP72DRAFT_21069 [Tulosesus angulatus]